MKELISLCASRPVTVIMAMAALGIAAVFSLTQMPLVRLPEISVPLVTVETVYAGMAAADIRTLVTIPMEDALSPVKGVQRIQSVSRDGTSLVSLDFRWGSDPMTASALVREAIDAVYPSLPEGVNKPIVTPGDNGTEVHAIVAVRSLRGDGNIARNMAEYEMRARFRRIDGVGSVILVGGETVEQNLRLDLPVLSARGLSPPEFARLVASEAQDIPAGNAREGDRELVVVSSGRPNSVDELSRLLLSAASGAFRLSEAGELKSAAARRKSVFAADGREAAALEIYRRPGADPVRLSREIQKTLKEAIPLFSRDVEIFLVRDCTPSLIRGVTGLGISAALGAAAVIVTLFIFIRRISYSLLAALSVPVSAAAGICALALTGKSLNSMSLGGLALGIGMVSDNSVIVLDLLHRSFGGRKAAPSAAEIGACTSSIAASGIGSTITTAVVFIPVIFLPGPLGSLFGDTAIALVASICSGWLYAQFCLSSLFRFFFHREIISPAGENSANARKLEKKYRSLLAPLLRRPQKIYAGAVLASVLGAFLLFLRPAVFINPDEAEEVCVSIVFPPGTIAESQAAAACLVSRFLAEFPRIKTVYGRAGAEDEDIGRRADPDYRKEELVLHCVLEKGIRRDTILSEIEQKLKDYFENSRFSFSDRPEKIQGDDNQFSAGVEFSVYHPKDRIETLLGLSSSMNFTVRGKDRQEVIARTNEAAEKIRKSSGSREVRVVTRPGGERPELRLYPNRAAQAFLGISGADIAETLYTLNGGLVAARLEIEGRPLDVRITGGLEETDKRPELALENVPLLNREGKAVYLGSLGRIQRHQAESALARLDRSDVIYLDLMPGQNLKETIRELSGRPWFSRADESVFRKYKYSLLINVALVLILLYMTMGAQFESFILPLILMLSIPFSLAGAGPAMLLFGRALDSGAVLGLIALFGLAVNNGLILFEIGNERICLGQTPAAAVYGGCVERLRPVLITSATTVFALMPLAINPLGASQASMSAAMMGGLAASTLLSLFALPPALIRFFTWRETR
jgi:multidrug efflux pump subunit AcrB